MIYKSIAAAAIPVFFSFKRNKKRRPPSLPRQAEGCQQHSERNVSNVDRKLGGGVFLFPSEQNWYSQFLPDLMEAFGIVLPVEYLVESNPVRPRKESLLLRFYSNTMRFYIASINGSIIIGGSGLFWIHE